MSRKRVSQTMILKYLNAQCERCHKKNNLTVHHKTPLSSGGKDDETNIKILCRKCQNIVHGTDKKKRDLR
jgi:5-methylcytosine-specific restriction endonuclease McrA